MVLLESTDAVLSKGDTAPDFTLLSTDGTKLNFFECNKHKAYLIIFMCNHCPYVEGNLDAINKLSKEYKDDLLIIGINSNDSDQYPEDSYSAMQTFVAQGRIKFIYLYDETQSVAKSCGAVCTPDPFLFDQNKKLVYHGRLNDWNPSKDGITEHSMRDAINCVIEGREMIEEKPSMGCSIKWKA